MIRTRFSSNDTNRNDGHEPGPRSQKRRAQAVLFLMSPLSIVVLFCITVLAHRSASESIDKSTKWTLPLPRSMLVHRWDALTTRNKHALVDSDYLPTDLPYVGQAPWKDTVMYEPHQEHPLDHECQNFRHPYHKTLVLDRSGWDFSPPRLPKLVCRNWRDDACEDDWALPPLGGNATHFLLTFTSLRCARSEDTKVSGLYGPGAFLAFLITAGFSVVHHEQRLFWSLPADSSPTGTAAFNQRRLASVDNELIAAMAYCVLSMGDVLLRAIRRDFGPSLHAALHIVLLVQQASSFLTTYWLAAYIHERKRAAASSLSSRFWAWATCYFLSCVTCVVALAVSSSFLTSVGDRVVGLGGFVFCVPLTLGLSTWLVLHPSVFHKRVSAADLLVFFVCLGGLTCFRVALGIQFVRMQAMKCMVCVECNTSWVQRMLPTSSISLVDLDQIATLVGVLAVVFRGVLGHLHRRFGPRIEAFLHVGTSEEADQGVQQEALIEHDGASMAAVEHEAGAHPVWHGAFRAPETRQWSTASNAEAVGFGPPTRRRSSWFTATAARA